MGCGERACELTSVPHDFTCGVGGPARVERISDSVILRMEGRPDIRRNTPRLLRPRVTDFLIQKRGLDHELTTI